MTSTAPARPFVGAPCPSCSCPVVSERGAEPWCPSCGWNIEYFEPERRDSDMRWRWADRFSFRTAYQLNERQFADLAGRPLDKPGFSGIKAVLSLLSVMLLAWIAGLAVAGIWVMIHFHTLVTYIAGAMMLFFAFVLRPRFGKLDEYAEPVSDESVPTLARVIRQVADGIGAPVPDTLVLSSDFNAKAGMYGLRRRRYLEIGLPLWLSLTPQQQVALLGHELGHYVNGDVRTGWLTSIPVRTFQVLAYMTRPEKGRSRYSRGAGFGGMRANPLAILGDMVVRLVMSVFHLAFAMILLGMEWLSLRDSHLSEYVADSMSVRAAGVEAATGVLDTLLLRDVCVTMLRKAMNAGTAPQVWRETVSFGLSDVGSRIPNLRQLSTRDGASLFRSHPPVGLRAAMTESRPAVDPAVVLTEEEAARIDQELASRYKTLRTDIVNSSWR
jgi:heat shock protein HtpX